jgi:hypothetical protein
MHGRDRWLSGIALQVIALVTACGAAQAQTAASGLAAAGTGTRIDPYAFGAAPAAPGAYGAAMAAQAATAAQASAAAQAAAANQSIVTPNPALDPLGLNYVYGPAYGGTAVPMTGTQAGLSMLMMQQRMLGIGNGQLSGVRGGAVSGAGARAAGLAPRDGGAATSRAIAAHTRNMNIPGGQAARYFNRAGAPAVRNQPSFQRTTRFFPQTGQ